jgi:hypothetical protein
MPNEQTGNVRCVSLTTKATFKEYLKVQNEVTYFFNNKLAHYYFEDIMAAVYE